MLDVPPYTIFLLPGLTVHDQASPTNMILQNISLATSGMFKCEISGGPPRSHIYHTTQTSHTFSYQPGSPLTRLSPRYRW